jgi:RecJ-like exonuclease
MSSSEQSDSDYDSDFSDIGMRDYVNDINDQTRRMQLKEETFKKFERIILHLSQHMTNYFQTYDQNNLEQHLRQIQMEIFHNRHFSRACNIAMNVAKLSDEQKSMIRVILTDMREEINAELQEVIKHVKSEREADLLKQIVDEEELKTVDRAIYKMWTTMD